MEYNKELEIVILINIRNNETVPYHKTHKLFDNKWHIYCYRFIELTREALFEIAPYKLTPKGKNRLIELLAERNDEIKMNLAKLKSPGKASDPFILNGTTRKFIQKINKRYSISKTIHLVKHLCQPNFKKRMPGPGIEMNYLNN
jgi:hypothetical protein